MLLEFGPADFQQLEFARFLNQYCNDLVYSSLLTLFELEIRGGSLATLHNDIVANVLAIVETL